MFFTQGLTVHTHFIASTGIGGRQQDPNVLSQMDNYAIAGIRQEQIRYLYASTHLNRTSDYGVSFERGTRVDYADRRHVFISGTASINNKGEIMYPKDVEKQTRRMWENVEALLQEARHSPCLNYKVFKLYTNNPELSVNCCAQYFMNNYMTIIC